MKRRARHWEFGFGFVFVSCVRACVRAGEAKLRVNLLIVSQ